ncbi:membrane protein [Synergistales bacterium]|nr:membrane protein [Synergistales bacterium]
MNEVNPARSFGFLGAASLCLIITNGFDWPQIGLMPMIVLIFSVIMSSVVGDQLYIYSIRKIGASIAVSVSSVYLLVSAVTAIIVLKESVTIPVASGTALIIAGILVITHISKDKDKGNKPKRGSLSAADMLSGAVLSLGAAFCWGISMPLVKLMMDMGDQLSPTELYFWRSVVYLALIWGVRFVEMWKFPGVVTPMRNISPAAWLALLASGAFGLAFGGVLFAACANILPMTVAAPISAASPLFTILMARFMCGEHLTKAQNAGVALVMTGSVVISL